MAKVTGILSDRAFRTWPSWQIVYEWEDSIAQTLNIPISTIPKLTGLFYGAINKLKLNAFFKWRDKLKSKSNGVQLYFEMTARQRSGYANSKNVIPVIIDFFYTQAQLPSFYDAYDQCRLVLISSIEVYDYLKANNCPLNIAHLALSLPDQYLNKSAPKTIDVLMAGRKDPVLWEYLQQYSIQNPSIEFASQQENNGELYYVSNKKGTLGKFQTREQYYRLLQSAKVGFYTTPGMGGRKKDAFGFNPVTPRFLELLSAGCKVISRFNDNAETKYYQMEEKSFKVNDYESFVSYLNDALVAENYLPDTGYLIKHTSSTRAHELVQILKDI